MVSSAPRLAPSSVNCTPATPDPGLSVAVALRVTVPDTFPLGGSGEAHRGRGVIGVTVTLTAVDVVLLLAASRATAVSRWVPLLTWVVFHDTL